jgi:hypothetical protein
MAQDGERSILVRSTASAAARDTQVADLFRPGRLSSS